jgi:hypothetical protein
MFSPIRYTAEDVNLDTDEHGFELVITDTDGMIHRVNVHGCLLKLALVGRAISDYVAEGQREAMAQEASLRAAAREEADVDAR